MTAPAARAAFIAALHDQLGDLADRPPEALADHVLTVLRRDGWDLLPASLGHHPTPPHPAGRPR